MMVNGYLRFIYSSNEQIDENGDPVGMEEKLGEPLPCYISPIEYNGLAISNGNSFTAASYKITIESIHNITENSLTLEMNGRDLGKFNIIQIKPLNVVGCTKLFV